MRPTFHKSLMKVSILAAAIALSTCLMAQSRQAGSKVFHTSGAFVWMSSPTVSGSQVWIYASHTDHPGTPATFLEFDIFTPHPDGTFTDTFGSGDVPEDALSGNSSKNLSLIVDTSTATSFQTTTCESNGTCHAGPTGLLHIDFRTDGDYTDRTISENHYTFFQTVQRSHYNYDSSSALANGSILGHSINNGSSQMGTNRSTTITLTRKH